MGKQYDEYLKSHRDNTEKGLTWMKEHIPNVLKDDRLDGINLDNQISMHDKSKNGKDEYDAYDDYFYGKKTAEVKAKFDLAWLHHIHNNPHHWQYWLLINDDEGIQALDIPYNYIIEMICDWWSFSWKSGNLGEIFNWYDDHKEIMNISNKTRNTVESILNDIRAKLTNVSDDDYDYLMQSKVSV